MSQFKPNVLFLIASDPRLSPKPAEAVRIAVGVGVWQKVAVSIYLRGAAVLALSEHPPRLIDEENFARYLPLAAEWDRPIYAQRGAPLLAGPGEALLAYAEIDDAALAALAARSASVLRF
ncbi:MAG: hypothetical protein HY674_15095 [Chloroflexi bacterium]|nr:hypothetical protein [Chloroflexota bacterium]